MDNLGSVYARLGRYEDALDCLQRSLIIVREIGARDTEAVVLGNLGEVYWRAGRYDEAVSHLRQVLAMNDTAVLLHGCECDTFYYLGLAYNGLGHYGDALDQLQRALAVARERYAVLVEVQALNGLGETHTARGRPNEALVQHQHALTLARHVNACDEQARAHAGIARALDATGNPHKARQRWQRALTLYTDLGVPEANEVQQRLAITAARNTNHRTWRTIFRRPDTTIGVARESPVNGQS